MIRRYYRRMGSKWLAEKLGIKYTAVRARALRLGVSSRGRKWTTFEDKYLRRKYKDKLTAQQIAKALGRTEAQVRNRVQKLGLGESRSPRWSKEELAYLEKHYARKSIEEMAGELDRTPFSIKLKGSRMGLGKYVVTKGPNERQKRYIREHLGKIPYTIMSQKLGISVYNISKYASSIGVSIRPTSRRWTPEDEEQLRQLWGTMLRSEVARELNRTLEAVSLRARQLGLTKSHRTHSKKIKWSTKEDQIIRKHYIDWGKKKVAERLGRTEIAVVHRAGQLGATRTIKAWTEEEITELRRLYGTMPYRNIAERLERTVSQVEHKALQLGLQLTPEQQEQLKTFFPGHWTPEEKALLKELIGTMPVREIAVKLGRSYNSVRSKTTKLGLLKDNNENNRK